MAFRRRRRFSKRSRYGNRKRRRGFGGKYRSRRMKRLKFYRPTRGGIRL